MNVRSASRVRGWFNSLFALGFLLFATGANADGPLPANEARGVETNPADAQAVASQIYTDPRGRFTIRHSDDWKLILNWGGMPKPFCMFQACRATPLASCEFSLMEDKDFTDFDPALLLLAFPGMMKDTDLGLLGTLKGDGSRFKERKLGKNSWFQVQFNIDLFNLTEFTTSLWFHTRDKTAALMMCQAPKDSVPNLNEKAEELLRGFMLTKP
jgi:hypothetical protein